MFMASRYPTRLIVRCTECHGVAIVDRAELEQRHQAFCIPCGVPLVVFGVVVGCPLGVDLTRYGKPVPVRVCPACQEPAGDMLTPAGAGLPPVLSVADRPPLIFC